MYPLIPGEMIHATVQLAVYFVTAVGVMIAFVLTART